MVRKRTLGFALPTVLISSVILFIVLVSVVASSAGVRSSIASQYYQQLAREAAESGLARANDCLQANGYTPQWSDASPLRPNTSCSGGAACTNTDSCFISRSGNVRTTFRIDGAIDQNTSQLIRSTGTVELTRSSGAVWKSYTYSSSAKVGIDLSFNTVTFGYSLNGSFFATIGADGVMRATGYNGFGQLGNGSYSSSLTPTVFELPGGEQAVAAYSNFLSVGWNMFALTDSGRVFGAGYNNNGQLGDGSTTTYRPTPVEFKLPAGKQARFVAPLGISTFVTTTDNNIYAAGGCNMGVLGYNYTISGCGIQPNPVRVALPTPNVADPNTIPTDNFVVDRYTAILRMEGGRVYGWGDNEHGELGNGTFTPRSVPQQMGIFGNAGQPKAVQAAFDGNSTYILDDNGKVWVAGYNRFGQQSDGTLTDRTDFHIIPIPVSAGPVVKISTDQWWVSCLTANGEVWSVGLNNMGQLGSGTAIDEQTSPVKFILPAGVKAVDLYVTSTGTTTANNNLLVIGDNGRVYGAGSNVYGQLGDGTTTNRSTPVVMSVINGTTIRAKQVQIGKGAAVILTENNKIYTVGNNEDGQLGDGTTTNSSVPKANRYTNVLPVTSF